MSGINRNSGASEPGRNPALTGLFGKLSQVTRATGKGIGSPFEGFHPQVDSFFSASEGVGRALAKTSDQSIPLQNALPALSKYLGNASRLNNLAA